MRPMKYEEFSKEVVKRFRKVYDWNVVVGNERAERERLRKAERKKL